jgi:hypothetical protein
MEGCWRRSQYRGKRSEWRFRSAIIADNFLRDVCRTYEIAKLKAPGAQQKIENILGALAVVHPDVGYCQGMSFIAGEILNVVGEEELAFWLFAGLIERHHMKPLYTAVQSSGMK